MKNSRFRSLILLFFVGLFIFGLGIFTLRLYQNAFAWVMQPFNKHISGEKYSSLGDILDRNDVILATSKDGKRQYNDNEMVRKAMIHTVGDNSNQIYTSVQNLYRDELCGYNFLLGIKPPSFLKSNKNIKLTLDSKLCVTALKAMGEKRGAVAVYNYKTGEVLCMVSTPTYDPNFPPEITDKNKDLYDGIYINRVLSSAYTPGSVFKLVTSACGLESMSDIDEKRYTCHRKQAVNGKDITCMGDHGNIGINEALMRSCNIYFADLAIELGKDKMMKTANELGFNKSFTVNRAEIKKSRYDVSNADDYQLGWSGVGQFEDLLNPMHSLMIMGAIANEGKVVIPNIIADTYVQEENPFNLNFMRSESKLIDFMSKETADKLKEMMRNNVQKGYGDSMFPGLSVHAKTGTAEVGEGKQPHGWMIGFSGDERTPYAFAVIVENSGYGRTQAGPVASAVMAEACRI